MFENMKDSILMNNRLIPSKFNKLIKLIIWHKLMKEIKIFFILNILFSLVINNIKKLFNVGTVIHNQMVNEGFSLAEQLFFLFLKFLLLLEKKMLCDFVGLLFADWFDTQH
jgi:hypothetical protein